MGSQNVWVFEFMGTQNFEGKQNLWVVKMWVLKNVWVSKICGYSIFGIFKMFGYSNLWVLKFVGTNFFTETSNLWVSKICG